MNDSIRHDTEAFLHQQIPLTRAMGVTVAAWDGQRLVLEAPLAPNHNHLGTAFGGSLSALTTLAGYSLLWLLLGDHRLHIVVRESSIRYRHPVRSTLRAICGRPEKAPWDAFHQQLDQTGRAQLSLRVTVEEGGLTCVEFTGSFVAMR